MNAALIANASQAMSTRTSSRRTTHGRGRVALADSARRRGTEEIAAKTPSLLEHDPCLDQHVECRRCSGGIVLAVEHAHRVVECPYRAERALAAGHALVV